MVQLINPANHPIKDAARRRDRSKGVDKQRISTCKVCLCGVYDIEQWKFYRRPTGINHVACVEERDA